MKLQYFAKKRKIFERWGLRSQTTKTAPPHCEFLATRLVLSPNSIEDQKIKVFIAIRYYNQA